MIDRFTGRYHFLSNFHFCKVDYRGIVYRSSEHAYQAAKFTDPKEKKIVSRIYRPSGAKQYAGRHKHDRDPNFDKLRVMEEILRIKFSNRHLQEKLLDTIPHELVEGNDWGDTYWGVSAGAGHNHLGIILMRIRYDIFKENQR